jgi:hypothetical protein
MEFTFHADIIEIIRAQLASNDGSMSSQCAHFFTKHVHAIRAGISFTELIHVHGGPPLSEIENYIRELSVRNMRLTIPTTLDEISTIMRQPLATG